VDDVTAGFCEYTFKALDMNYEDYVVLDEKYLRPEELDELKGDCTRLKEKLGWTPDYTFEQMIDEMIDCELSRSYNVTLEEIL